MSDYYDSPVDVNIGALARSAHINNLDAAVEAAFDLLPTPAELTQGSTNIAVDTGIANAYLATVAHTPAGYVDGLTVVLIPDNTNSGGSTVDVNELGVISVRAITGDLLVAGDIREGVPVIMVYSSASNYFYAINTTSALNESGVGLNTVNGWNAQQYGVEGVLTSDSNAVAWNLDYSQNALHILTENTTISEPDNMKAGGQYAIRVVQGAGPYTLEWNAAFDFGAQITPAEPAAEDDVVIISFYSDGTTMYGGEFNRSEA